MFSGIESCGSAFAKPPSPRLWRAEGLRRRTRLWRDKSARQLTQVTRIGKRARLRRWRKRLAFADFEIVVALASSQ